MSFTLTSQSFSFIPNNSTNCSGCFRLLLSCRHDLLLHVSSHQIINDQSAHQPLSPAPQMWRLLSSLSFQMFIIFSPICKSSVSISKITKWFLETTLKVFSRSWSLSLKTTETVSQITENQTVSRFVRSHTSSPRLSLQMKIGTVSCECCKKQQKSRFLCQTLHFHPYLSITTPHTHSLTLRLIKLSTQPPAKVQQDLDWMRLQQPRLRRGRGGRKRQNVYVKLLL